MYEAFIEKHICIFRLVCMRILNQACKSHYKKNLIKLIEPSAVLLRFSHWILSIQSIDSRIISVMRRIDDLKFDYFSCFKFFPRFLLIICELSSYNFKPMTKTLKSMDATTIKKVTRTYEYRKEKEEENQKYQAHESRVWVCVIVFSISNSRLPLLLLQATYASMRCVALYKCMSVRIFRAFQNESRLWICFFSSYNFQREFLSFNKYFNWPLISSHNSPTVSNYCQFFIFG